MKSIEFKGIPTFRINNYDEAIKFYVDFLGFTVDWEHRFSPAEPVYMQIARNGLVIHLSENKRFLSGCIIFIETKEIETFQSELKNKHSQFFVPEIEITNWGTKQIEIKDPFENLLRFNQL